VRSTGRSDVANVSCFEQLFTGVSIPPDGTAYYPIGPREDLAAGAITVTAIPVDGLPANRNLYMEVIQMATRRGPGIGAGGPQPRNFLDVVVRNNSHVDSSPSTTITAFVLYVAIVTP
jgi:hypothetical protein